MRTKGDWDKLGIVSSGLCVAHCILMPFCLPILGAAGWVVLEDSIFHPVLALLATGAAVASFRSGCRGHSNRNAILAAFPGITMLLLTAFNPYSILGEDAERQLTIAGAALLSLAHGLNWQSLRGDCGRASPSGPLEIL